ncbi:hypothetical protein J6590_072504 [Homalodisca vitripennis]|nr:hypothetical protein J6590_072504 [Homalodisca vitripennis]
MVNIYYYCTAPHSPSDSFPLHMRASINTLSFLIAEVNARDYIQNKKRPICTTNNNKNKILTGMLTAPFYFKVDKTLHFTNNGLLFHSDTEENHHQTVIFPNYIKFS